MLLLYLSFSDSPPLPTPTITNIFCFVKMRDMDICEWRYWVSVTNLDCHVAYQCRELPQVSFLSRQIFVTTNTCLSQQKFCQDKHTFVATKDVFCFCRDKNVTCGSSRENDSCVQCWEEEKIKKIKRVEDQSTRKCRLFQIKSIFIIHQYTKHKNVNFPLTHGLKKVHLK